MKITMKKTIYSLGLKSVSLILSGVLIFQCSAPAYAQAAALGSAAVAADAEQRADLSAKLDNIYLRENVSEGEFEKAFKREVQRQLTTIAPLAKELSALRQTGKNKYGNNYIAYAGTVGVNTIGKLTYELKQFMAFMFVEPKALSFAEFKKDYDTFIEEQAQQYVKANKSSLSFKATDALGNAVDKKITKDMLLTEIKKQFPAKTVYKEYLANANKEIKWYKDNQAKINLEYYKVLREYVKAFGPENISYEAARLLGNLKLNGKPVILPEEKTAIYNYAVKRINNADLKEAFDASLFSTSSARKAKEQVAAKTLQDLADLMIIGAYMAPSNNEAYANAVVRLINVSYDTVAFPHVLNAGFGSLLGLKRYDKLDAVLDKYTRLENGEGRDWLDTLGDISFENAAKALFYSTEFLRGTPSQNAQYAGANKDEYKNAFEDVAKLLAEEGSPKSLALLKKYGADKGFKSIFPFFAGALESGKAGATLQNVAATLGPKGNAQQTLAKDGLTPDSFYALRMANFSMSDLTIKQEYTLDFALLSKYPEIATKLKDGAVINSKSVAVKASDRNTYGYANRAGVAADILFMVWATFDIARLAGKAASFAKAMYVSINALKITNPALRSAAIMKNLPSIRRFVKTRASLRAFSTRMNGAMASVVLGQRGLYTSEALPKIAGAGAENTTTAHILNAVTANAAGDGLALDKAAAMAATANQSGRVSEIAKVEKTLELANNAAKENFINRSFFNKYRSYSSYLSAATKDAFRSQGYTGYALDAGLNLGDAIKGSDLFKAPSLSAAETAKGGVNWLSRPLSATLHTGSVGLFFRTAEGADAMPLPVEVNFSGKVPGIKSGKVSEVLLTEGDKFKLSVNHGNKIVDPSFFKIGVDNDSFAQLAKLSLTSKQPLNFKLMAEPSTFLGRFSSGVRDFFSKKNQLFSGTGSVFVRDASGSLRPTSLTLSTPREFNGIKVVVGQDNSIALMGRGNLASSAHFAKPYMFALPKGELPRFAQYAKGVSFEEPLTLTISGAKNKINTLYAIQFLSLSAASTGLVGPLKENYPDMSETTSSLIAVGLPYASSFLSPVWAPLVKQFGSANMMKASLALAGASLLVPTFTGFNGFGDINKENPNKPAYWPLLVSAGLIGFSSSITRASFNPLMDAIGGGAGQFKSFMFKNLSGYAMLVPPAIAAGVDYFWPRYYTNADGSIKRDKKTNEAIKHPWTDFAFYNPFLLGITGFIFYKFHTSRMPTHIGRVEGYKIQSAKFLGKEAWSSTKTILRPEVLPFTIAATAALGVESSMFNKYGNSKAKDYTEDYFGVTNPAFKPIVAMASISLAQLFTRKYSKPLLKLFGGDNPLGYKRLTAASLITAGSGVSLLATENDNPASFVLGASLVGVGFANTTTGFKMLGQSKLKDMGASKAVLTEWNVAYPAVHIGMAAIPAIHNLAADADRENDPSLSKSDAMQKNIWIPALTLGASGYFYSKGIGLLKAGQTGSFLAPFKHGAAFAYPIGRGVDLGNNNPFQLKPVLTAPKAQFDLKPSNPFKAIQDPASEEALPTQKM